MLRQPGALWSVQLAQRQFRTSQTLLKKQDDEDLYGK